MPGRVERMVVISDVRADLGAPATPMSSGGSSAGSNDPLRVSKYFLGSWPMGTVSSRLSRSWPVL